MIIDTIQNASTYFAIHPLFTKAFHHILHTDCANAAPGKYPLEEGLNVIVSNGMGKTKEASLAKFECHDKHIDIQLCIKGNETIGWKPRLACITPNGSYQQEKDVSFYSDAPDTFFQLTDGEFAIFFPNDVHAPMIGDDEIKKMIIKVKI